MERYRPGKSHIQMKRSAFHIAFILVISLGFIHVGFAYIPSAGQILQPFLKTYSGLHTIRIDMETVIYDDLSEKTEIGEQLLIKKGCMFRDERVFSHGDNILIQDGRKTLNLGVETANADERRIDAVFPTIFFQKSVNDLLNTLNFLGVDTGTVSIDRMDGKVVFVAGKGLEVAPGSRLWIERKRSLPLRFVGVGMSGGERIVLRAEYLDYHQVSKRFWLPERIEYYRNDVLWVVSIVKNVTINENMPETLFKMPGEENVCSPVANFLNIRE
jgi:outer membrane lipoprotein-sorting protein